MIVNNKNEGKKIKSQISGNKITFGEDEVTLNLEAYERDELVKIDICIDENKNLTAGMLANAYIAQISIPPREYTQEEIPKATPFSIEKCTLDLWALVEVV